MIARFPLPHKEGDDQLPARADPTRADQDDGPLPLPHKEGDDRLQTQLWLRVGQEAAEDHPDGDVAWVRTTPPVDDDAPM